MTPLSDDLLHLTAGQPAQPGDRLTSVMGKARRMKRTRNALALAAVLAVATPAGVLAVTSQSAPAVQYADRPATWSDRSSDAGRGLARGALAQWQDDHGVPASVTWLYRDVVQVPDDKAFAVAAFVADGRLVAGWADRTGLDASGRPKSTDGTHWKLDDVAADQAPGQLSFYLPSFAGQVEDNWMVVLADPDTRTMRWTVRPLENAPTGPQYLDQGSFTSRDGVFQGPTGPITGPLSVTFDEQRTAAPAALSFPDAEPVLAAVPNPPGGDLGVGGLTGGIIGGAGALTAGDPSVGYGADTRTGATVYVSCYGGGRLELLVGKTIVGSVPCELAEHTVVIPADKGGQLFSVRGTRYQVFAFGLGATTR